MKNIDNKVNIGIGFVTGRPNVCKVINNEYKKLINQFKENDKEIQITIFILYDLKYQGATREDFYKLNPEVYKSMKIEYITPEDIEIMKETLIKSNKIDFEESNLFFGNGHARGRNTLMYFALIKNIDYLLFWDDDEYPIACILDNETKKIKWKEQDNILIQYNYIQNADVTIGYHCGYVSPIPYIELSKDVNENVFRDYIEAVSNDIISWNSIKEKNEKYNGVTYVNEEIINNKNTSYEIKMQDGGKWVAGSTLCLNLNNIDKIPAFYNPEGARRRRYFLFNNVTRFKSCKSSCISFS